MKKLMALLLTLAMVLCLPCWIPATPQNPPNNSIANISPRWSHSGGAFIRCEGQNHSGFPGRRR